MDRKIHVLQNVYALYDRLVADTEVACRKYCATCCTTNVTMTGLEGELILKALDPSARDRLARRIQAAASCERFLPSVTTNRMAVLCMEGKSLPEEKVPEYPAPCPLLEGEQCTIYAFRPFGCRSMVSNRPCPGHGFARMDPLMVSLNTVFLQFIEHLDVPGMTGNLIDILGHALDSPVGGGCDPILPEWSPLVENHAIKRLMIPPEHGERIFHVVQELNRIGTAT